MPFLFAELDHIFPRCFPLLILFSGCLEAQCENGQCVRREQLCDNFPDCVDGSDERNCSFSKLNGMLNTCLRRP